MAIEGASKIAQTASGLIGILGGLLTAVAAFDAQVRGAITVFARMGVLELGVLGATLLSVGLALFMLSRRKASRLLDPDALRLDPHRPEHLIGRSEDVRLLCEKCVARPLVFLVGDSGAGKSALVRAGLVPAVESAGRLLAVYIDMANLDWDGDACEALADCFWRCLPAGARDTLNAARPPAVTDLPRLLQACYPTHGRTPLVVLDQIDDYQLRHRERFLPPDSMNWISAAQLIDANRFWGMLAPLVRARHLHILIITRSDNADGLESLRLADNPIVARLDPLPAGFILRVIDQLVSRPTGVAPVIENPEAGWNRLRVRLAQDLERGGLVLPQQLKIALLGLGRLGRLSVPNFERVGGVPGLEARYTADSLGRSAARVGLDAAVVRRALVRLVEPDGTRRAPPLPLPELASGLVEGDAAQLAGAFEALEEADILRRRQVGGIDAWQLDHDYLARGILRIEAESDRYRVMLARRGAEFADARGSLLARWRTLLTTREQLAFLLARARRRFRYGEHRWFAALSVVPHATCLAFAGAAIVIGYAAIGEFAAKSAWQAMLTGNTSSSEAALGNIAEWPSVVRWAFVRQLLEEPDRAQRTATQPQSLVRAIVGLDEDRASELARRVVASTAGTKKDAAVDLAAAILPLLPASALRAIPDNLATVLVEAQAHGIPLDTAVVRTLATGRQWEADAARTFEKILDELTDDEQADRGSLGAGNHFAAAAELPRVSRRVSPEALANGAERLHEALFAAHKRHSAVGPLALAYTILVRRLPPASQDTATAALADAITTQDPDLGSFAGALALIAARMPHGVSSITAGRLLDKLRDAQGDVFSVYALAVSFAAAVPPSAEQERAAAATFVLNEMKAHVTDTIFVDTLLADAHAALTLSANAGSAQRAEVRGILGNVIGNSPTGNTSAVQPQARLRELFSVCGSNDCARLFASVVIDGAVAKSFDERAMLIIELLKVPALADVTNMLLARLRSEDGATAAGLPDGGLWQIAAWAKARGLDPATPLDAEKLLSALPAGQ
jgi:hypothetical protein